MTLAVSGAKARMNANPSSRIASFSGPASILPVTGCRFLPTQLIIDDDIQFEQWERIGEFLWTLEEGVQWWLGDWLNFGERKYGESYAQAAEVVPYKVETLKNAAYVASQFELSSREDNLSWGHHKAVVGLEADDRRDLLAKAKEEQWNCRETERRARARKTFKEIEKRPDTIWTVNQEMAERWLVVREQVRRFAESYPQATSATDSYVEEIEYLLKEGAKTDFKAILLYWIGEGCESIESLVNATKKDRLVIKVALDDLVESGKLRTVKQGGKTDFARGAAITLYLINYQPEAEGQTIESDDDL
jgi:hypothetical protein